QSVSRHRCRQVAESRVCAPSKLHALSSTVFPLVGICKRDGRVIRAQGGDSTGWIAGGKTGHEYLPHPCFTCVDNCVFTTPTFFDPAAHVGHQENTVHRRDTEQ